MNSLIDKSRIDIKLGDFGSAPATALADYSLLPRVQDYRRTTGSRMMPLDGEEISEKIPTADYHVSRKVDGEFTVLIFRDGECLSLNPGGTVRVGLPWLNEAAETLAGAGLKSALIAGELYAHNEERRPRVHDVTSLARQPQSPDDLQQLRFAVFDIIAVNDEPNELAYGDTFKFIEKLFEGGDKVHPVETKQVADSNQIKKLFSKWVEKEGAEGLVVRSDIAGMFKVKPRHNLDAVVIGFTESTEDREGMLHDMLVAVMRHDGALQVLTRVGGGFSNEQRRDLLSDLKDMVVESEYAEVNSDHVAYQMVRPDWVVEISCLDLISQTTRGGSVNRMVLNFANNGSARYETIRRMPLAAVISPQFIRIREDKSAQKDDVRIEQVSQRVEVQQADRDAGQMTLPKSEIVRRDVYTKEAKGETMVRKFVTIQTNKENEGEEYTAYVLHYTDFSPNRKSPLARDVRVSSSLDQISALHRQMIDDNIKKGWSLHSSTHREVEPVAEEAPAKKKTTPKKKKAATKKTAKKKPTKKKTAAKKKTKPVEGKLAPSKGTRKKSHKKKSG